MGYRLFIATLEEKLRIANVSGVEQDILFKALLDGWEQGPYDEYWLWICEEGPIGSGELRFQHIVQSIVDEHFRNEWDAPKIQNRVFTQACFRAFELCRDETSLAMQEWDVPLGTRTTAVLTAPFLGINLGFLFPFHPGLAPEQQPESQKDVEIVYFGSEGVIHARVPRLNLSLMQGESLLPTMERVVELGGIAHGNLKLPRLSDAVIENAEVTARESISVGDPGELVGTGAYRVLLRASLVDFLEGVALLKEGAFFPAKEKFEVAARLTELLPEVVGRKMDPVCSAWMIYFGSRFMTYVCDWASTQDEYGEYRYRLIRTWTLAMEASKLLGPHGTGNAIDLARQAIFEMRKANILAAIGAMSGSGEADLLSLHQGRPILFPDRSDEEGNYMPPLRIQEPILSGGRTIMQFADDVGESWSVHDVLQICQFLGVWLLDETRASSFTVFPCVPETTPCRTPFDTMPGGTEWMQHLAFLCLAETLI